MSPSSLSLEGRWRINSLTEARRARGIVECAVGLDSPVELLGIIAAPDAWIEKINQPLQTIVIPTVDESGNNIRADIELALAPDVEILLQHGDCRVRSEKKIDVDE